MIEKARGIVLPIFAAALIWAGSASSQSGPLVSNVFFDTDLRQALEDVAAQAGVNIVADPSVGGLVTLELEDVPVERALDLMLAGTEYQVYRGENYFLVFSPDETSGAFVDVSETRVFDLRHVTADAARSMLPNPLQRYVRVDPSSNAVAITAPERIMRRIIADLGTIDSPAEQTQFVPMVHVRASAARTMLPEHLQRFVRVDEERETLAVSAPASSQATIIEHLRRLDRPRTAGSFGVPDVHPTRIVKLQHAKAGTTLNLLPEAVQQFVRADEATNTLAVSAPDTLMHRILGDISTIDVARQHIMLDARVVVLERADVLDFGAEWRLPTIQAGASIGSALTGFPWEMRIGYAPDGTFTNALSLTLNMLSQNNEATIIASPQVLAQDGIESEIRVTTEEYFQITADSGTFIRAELEKIETGTILRITPQVGPRGELTLDMNIEVSDVVSRGERNLPVVSRRTARNTVQIQSGGTAAIAGLADTRSQLNRAGLPGSHSVPLLGRAFRTDTVNHQARQVAVFVTATLVNERGGKLEAARPVMPPLRTIDERSYRMELEAALDRMEGRP